MKFYDMIIIYVFIFIKKNIYNLIIRKLFYYPDDYKNEISSN